MQNFAYIMSHDLQDPLKTISNYLGLIKKRYSNKLDKDGNEFVDFTIDASKNMQRLINDLLTYSRITNSIENYTKIDLNKIFDEAVSNLNGLNNNSITHDKLPIINGIYSQLIIVFQNLLSNALKFCNKEPVIHVSYKKDDYYHIISFKDNGIGIKKQDYLRVFKIFERLNPQAEYQGTGLGLAIVKKIIEHHKGKIWFKSALGNSSTFYISLPINN
ncbi:MAG TPA: ATP-binding protein [Candidatus Nanoarchaeia archaeon]|nr:ATP-binding protein [Candidatus Nanoarchaeia archaeon]